VRLAGVGGMDDVKRRLELSFLAPLHHPDIKAQFGKSLRGGLLLWGPPGCGKTFIARALAGELGASFYVVGLNDVLDMWIGSSERNLSAIFGTARRNHPCVQILRLHLRGKPTEALDLRRIVRTTDGFSGADLALICDHATERAMDASLRSGTIRAITQADLTDGVRNIRPSVKPWLDIARNYATYSNEHGAFDELLAYLKRHR
jgi:SpoVK/Ycf46/Vps4 family AAA+-type ATPase